MLWTQQFEKNVAGMCEPEAPGGELGGVVSRCALSAVKVGD